MPPVFISPCITSLCHVTLQFSDQQINHWLWPRRLLWPTKLADVIQAEAWKRACITGLVLLHLYYFYKKSTPGLAHLFQDGNEKYVGQSCPKEAAPDQTSPAQPRTEPSSWPRDAWTHLAKSRRSASQPSHELQVQCLEWEVIVVLCLWILRWFAP